MKFWDASAVAPLCVQEPRTTQLRALAREDSSLVVWWGTLIECGSAFARQRRGGGLSANGEEQALRALEALALEWTEVVPSLELRDQAMRLVRIHPVGAGDALQLAAAWIWADRNPRAHSLVSLDKRLREAARREGFTLVPAEA